jgi:hypothetical protein
MLDQSRQDESRIVGVQKHASIRFLGSLAAVLLAGLLGCSNHALKAVSDAGSEAERGREDANATTDTVTGFDTATAGPDAGVVDLPGLADAANPADAPADTGGTDAAADSSGDACVPVACTDEYGESFCGTICDGCGHTLDCGETCPRAGWICRNNVCTGATAVCTSLRCVHSSDESEYCGDTGDACGGTLHCPLVCAKAGWICQDNICVGRPDVCTPRTCANGFYDYCGDIGDGCGGTLHCSTTCPKDGWVCDNNICVGPPDVCSKLTCQFPGADICLSPPQVGNYCGKIGDGCGGTLDCGEKCPPGWICEDNICRGSAVMCMPVECESAAGDTYCGTINNCCGGTTNCNPVCPRGFTCVNHLCAFGPDCVTITCTPLGGGAYCGTIGDGCGGILDCPATCPNGDQCGEAHTCGTGANGGLPPPPPPPIAPPSGTWPEPTPPPVPSLRAPSLPPLAPRPAPTPPPC